jgi:hypothetical protein
MGQIITLGAGLKALANLDPSWFRRVNANIWNMFGGRRNLYDVFNYTVNPTFDQRYFKYLRQDIAGRVVDAPAAALWTNPPQVTSTDPIWNELWDDLIARYGLWSNVEKCDKLAGIGRFSLLLIGYNDKGALNTPVNTRAIKQVEQKILYLQPYSERCVTIKSFNNNTQDEDFQKPLIYEIQPMADYVVGYTQQPKRATNMLTSFEVHASRVIHIAENTLESPIWGSPRLERVYNVLDDLLKVTGGSAETYWLTANRGLHVDIDKEMELDPTDEKNLSAEVDEYQNQLRRIIRTRGTKVTSLGSDNPDPTGVFKMLVSVVSGATGIPHRVLIGSEAGQLASEQDRANWADRIDERRANWGNPSVLFPMMKKLTKSGYLPSSPETDITVDWPHAFKMSPLENAQTSAQHARSATNFAKAIETMHNLNKGTPGIPEQTLPDGTTVPGTPEEPGADLGELITIDEARAFIGLDKPPVTFDSSEDIGGEGEPTAPKAPTAPRRTSPSGATVQRIHDRKVKISMSTLMRV